MEPSGPTSGIPQTLAGLQRPASLQLQIGQQLQATVLDNSAGKILLAIGHRQLSAESSLPFQRGQALTLQVRSLGEQPVLRVIAALQESPAAMAVRMLLPRYGASTPLLASLPQLVQTPQAAVPPLIREAAGTLLRQLPEVAALSTPQGVKTAIRNSGGFLENHLVQAGRTPAASIDNDYKTNLLRLLQQVQRWTDSAQRPAAQRPATPAVPVPPAADRVAAQPPIAPPPSSPLTPQAPPPSNPLAPQAPTPTTTAPPPAADARPVPPSQSAPSQTTVQRAIHTALPAAGRSSAPPPAGTGPVLPAGGSPTTPVTGGLNPPPPFAGVVPSPQTPVQAGLDLLNRLGNLRLDLLQQIEAALARVNLNQLASLPREGEHRLVEWLFDLPVRRGGDVDLWSARLYRDAEGDTETQDEPVAQWSVQLAFDLPGLGPIQTQINLNGDRVSTHFWITRQDALPLIRENLNVLRETMLEVGLDVGDIDCRLGTLPASPGHQQDPLISEKA